MARASSASRRRGHRADPRRLRRYRSSALYVSSRLTVGLRVMAEREKAVREQHEDQVAEWEYKWKTNRCADAVTMREMKRTREKHDERAFAQSCPGQA